ncbi:MAG: aldo/keto reductase [Saccharofermentanales bacterium]
MEPAGGISGELHTATGYAGMIGSQTKPICFGSGTADIAHRLHDHELLDLFFLQGGRIIDTANIYGKWLAGGTNESEIVIGEWLSQRTGTGRSIHRADIVISTKGAHPDLDTMHVPRMGSADLEADLEESLRALQTDYIDIYWLHRDAPEMPVEQILRPLTDLRRQGTIRMFGLSNWTAGRTLEAVNYLGEEAKNLLFGTQNRWSHASMNPSGTEDETLVSMTGEEYRWHCESGYAAMPYSGMAKGYFTKLAKYGKENLHRKLLDYYDNPLNDRRMIALNRLSEETGHPVSQLAVAFLLSQPFPVFPIIGFSDREQLIDVFEATRISLNEDQMRNLSQGVNW